MSILKLMSGVELETAATAARAKMKEAPESVLKWYKMIRLASITGEIEVTLKSLINNLETTPTMSITDDMTWMYDSWREIMSEVVNSADPSSAADIVSCGVCLDVNELMYTFSNKE